MSVTTVLTNRTRDTNRSDATLRRFSNAEFRAENHGGAGSPFSQAARPEIKHPRAWAAGKIITFVGVRALRPGPLQAT